MDVRRVLYNDLIYPFQACGIVVGGQNAKELTRRIFTLLKRSEKYMAELKLESSRDTRQMKLLIVYSLYIQETILYAKKKSVTAQ
jgi:hypothetical protein